jgi:hypothetical protein
MKEELVERLIRRQLDNVFRAYSVTFIHQMSLAVICAEVYHNDEWAS